GCARSPGSPVLLRWVDDGPAEVFSLPAFDSRQHVLDDVPDFDRIERLHDVADSARLLAEPPVLVTGACREENDGDLAGLRVCGAAARDLPAVGARHHHVEEDPVEPLAAAE